MGDILSRHESAGVIILDFPASELWEISVCSQATQCMPSCDSSLIGLKHILCHLPFTIVSQETKQLAVQVAPPSTPVAQWQYLHLLKQNCLRLKQLEGQPSSSAACVITCGGCCCTAVQHVPLPRAPAFTPSQVFFLRALPSPHANLSVCWENPK